MASRGGYRVRRATLDDIDALVHHRLAMFAEMGTAFDAPVVRQLFHDWLMKMMPPGEYLAWLCETGAAEVVAGEPGHRKCGLARSVMDVIHAWCRANGVAALALNAAPAAQHLYESQGYRPAPSPMMWKIV
jgi:GNAT superfamily N-acetyltransferase